MNVTVRSIKEIATCIRSFELVPTTDESLPPFEAGAHIDVHLSGGLIRQYSLCGPPQLNNAYVIAVLETLDSKGGSRTMHELREGESITISEPKNHFPLTANARHSILLAGGIGITPLLCMAERLALQGASFELHYAAREQARAAFADRLMHPSLKTASHLYFDNEPSIGTLDLARTCANPCSGKHLYVCGPAGFIEATLGAARQAGWAEENLHREYFAGMLKADDESATFRLKLAKSGLVVDVQSGQTAIQALALQGIDVPTSCEQGVCGTCLTRVLDGVPDHRDMYLTNEERARNDYFLPCCSRAKSEELIVDL
ncbi:PDR/VanB family oxidoreductase [Paraburkholderia agricolaris]|uniref:PDR/VanB family oxidoreductase n=1 Tax=Paraburkholderia agricolaris TaxID=2152888 RepID=UPI0038B83D92